MAQFLLAPTNPELVREILGAFRHLHFSSGALCQSIHSRGVWAVWKIGMGLQRLLPGFSPAQTWGMLCRHHPPHPNSCWMVSAPLELATSQHKVPEEFLHGTFPGAQGSFWVLPSPPFYTPEFHISQFGHYTKSFCLLSSSSFFFPTFQFISCSPTAAFAGLFHQVDH